MTGMGKKYSIHWFFSSFLTSIFHLLLGWITFRDRSYELKSVFGQTSFATRGKGKEIKIQPPLPRLLHLQVCSLPINLLHCARKRDLYTGISTTNTVFSFSFPSSYTSQQPSRSLLTLPVLTSCLHPCVSVECVHELYVWMSVNECKCALFPYSSIHINISWCMVVTKILYKVD